LKKASFRSRKKSVWPPPSTNAVSLATASRPTNSGITRTSRIDLAQTPRGLEIVEVGSLLCVAWYEADPGAIVDALIEVL